MKYILKLFLSFFLLISLPSSAQNELPDGYPDRNPSFDILPGFINPPRGYGEVPFYWWQGDSLTRERISWQLDELSGKGISSLQINYSHRDSGGLSYGLSNPSKPPLFSEAWWNLFRWFADEAKKRDMTVSLSDYTIGVGQGYSMDEAIKNTPELNGSVLNSVILFASGTVNQKVPDNLLTLNAYRMAADSTVITENRKDLLGLVQNGLLSFKTGKGKWKIIGVFPEKVIPSFDPMNPKSGNAYIEYFFEKFENALPDKGTGMLNFFFSDELNFRLSGNLWDSGFAEEFRKRKGYDVIPCLDALFTNGDPAAPKIRLDYNDVMVSLSEQNFFKPVYLWHQERGMIYGCDHGGRGRDVTEFGDYFRTQRWNQGPGSDQPRLSKDIIKAKVASSIAHLYERPRVWLEGFHSSGWGTSSADVTDAIFANFAAGYNLLSFHGLYYSTIGSWWEWAPPDNHFRMPYWKQIDPLMICIRRLSFLLSQGFHRCDVAIIYPTEPVVADMDGERSVNLAFETGEALYNKGIDFDFIDYESIGRAAVRDKELQVAGEKYKVLIVPSMKAIRYSSLKKIDEFTKAGGIVVNIGDFPSATDKNGINDLETSILVTGIFSGSPYTILCREAGDVPSAIEGKYAQDFKILSEISGRPYMMHRVAGSRDIYALYNLEKGTRCFFNTRGSVRLWNPWTGEQSSLSEFAVEKGEGTEITLPLTSKDIQIIVFDHGNSETIEPLHRRQVISESDVAGLWEFELKPSLDNRWGDFELPATSGMIGAEIRQLYLAEDKEYSGGKLSFDNAWERITCGFGPHLIKLGPLPELPSDEEIKKMNPDTEKKSVIISGVEYIPQNYSFSWQKGVEGDYGHQGYHGLKGEMYNNFIRLGAIEEDKMSLKRVPEAGGNIYLLFTRVIAPDAGQYELLTGQVKPRSLYINNLKTDVNSRNVALRKGPNSVLMIYDKACETYLVFRESAVPRPERQPVSMIWYRDYGVLPFDCTTNNAKSGLFGFESAPGLHSVTFSAYGKVSAWINGVKAEAVAGKTDPDGLTAYYLNEENRIPGISQVIIKIEYLPGYTGGAALPFYFRQNCGKGLINLCDWSVTDGLKSYSGGAWYRRSITFDTNDLKDNIEIDLGDVVSSAEVFVNGKSAGIRVAPPWTFDITGFVAGGKNDIEVLVYNTLANNFIGVPTRYRGNIKSGLIGPVKIRIVSTPGGVYRAPTGL